MTCSSAVRAETGRLARHQPTQPARPGSQWRSGHCATARAWRRPPAARLRSSSMFRSFMPCPRPREGRSLDALADGLKPGSPAIRPRRSAGRQRRVLSRVVDCSATAENASTSTDRTAQVWNHQANHHCVALRDVRVPVRVGVLRGGTCAAAAAEHRHRAVPAARPVHRRAPGDCLDYDRIYHHLTRSGRPGSMSSCSRCWRRGWSSFVWPTAGGGVPVVIRKPEIYPGPATPEIAVYRPGRHDHRLLRPSAAVRRPRTSLMGVYVARCDGRSVHFALAI